MAHEIRAFVVQQDSRGTIRSWPLITVTFDELDGKTHLVSQSLCPSKEVRDAILAWGMEHGMRETWDQLDELVTSLPH